jgi:phenylpropionate dioxygenase-like ring-hydroxylating dioxygenase large terminal subunit
MARYDKPIPHGWYAVDYTSELKAGDVKPLHYFGQDLVLFRTESGEASLLKAFCPHLGAHLGYGGKVEGESISCPFHAWKFDGNGFCTDVPYAKRMPPKVDGQRAIDSYPLVERNQMIWAWYHPQGVEPLFEVEEFEELNSDDWTPMDTFDWQINTIIQETGENAADIAHFVTVHGALGMPDGVVTLEGHKRLTMMESKTSHIDEEGKVHRDDQVGDPAKLESWNIGPGLTYQRFSRMFDIVMMGTVTPIDDQNILLRFNFSMPKEQTEMHRLYANGFRDEVKYQVEQDIPIWENKVYLDAPILCDGDGPIAKYRKWFQQFYGEAA